MTMMMMMMMMTIIVLPLLYNPLGGYGEEKKGETKKRKKIEFKFGTGESYQQLLDDKLRFGGGIGYGLFGEKKYHHLAHSLP
jgi:hypothetical protein